MNSLGPIAGLLGAAIVSISVFKWILGGLAIVFIVWTIGKSRSAQNAIQSRALKDLIKSSTQWSTRALQDTNPIVGLINANYGMAYLNVARSLGTDADIEREIGTSVDTLIKEIEGTQTNAVARLSSSCPSVSPQGLVHNGWSKK
jgi:hypothetical protein